MTLFDFKLKKNHFFSFSNLMLEDKSSLSYLFSFSSLICSRR